MTAPMMKCGHAANSVCEGKPACVICAGLHPNAYVVDDAPPDLSARKARCFYFGRMADHRCESNYGTKRGEKCSAEQPSSPSLPFFEHKPGESFDSFYCGCASWD